MRQRQSLVPDLSINLTGNGLFCLGYLGPCRDRQSQKTPVITVVSTHNAPMIPKRWTLH